MGLQFTLDECQLHRGYLAAAWIRYHYPNGGKTLDPGLSSLLLSGGTLSDVFTLNWNCRRKAAILGSPGPLTKACLGRVSPCIGHSWSIFQPFLGFCPQVKLQAKNSRLKSEILPQGDVGPIKDPG
jgi:hypothetical protein